MPEKEIDIEIDIVNDTDDLTEQFSVALLTSCFCSSFPLKKRQYRIQEMKPKSRPPCSIMKTDEVNYVFKNAVSLDYSVTVCRCKDT